MRSSTLLLTTALASYASAKDILIGFRTVCEAEAHEINSRGWVFHDPAHSSAKENGQLGIGKSHSKSAGSWEMTGNTHSKDWICYSIAESSAIQKALKIWINPNLDTSKGTTYPYDETKIQSILTKAGAKNPDRTFRLGLIPGDEELLIPVGRLPGKDDTELGPLGLQTFCFETEEEMRQHMKENDILETVANYDSEFFANDKDKKYKVVDQKRATIDEGEDEAVAGPTRRLRFMPRDTKKTTKGSGKTTTTKDSGKKDNTKDTTKGTTKDTTKGTTKDTTKDTGKQGTTAGGSSSDTLELAKGYTISLKKDPKSKKFPKLKVEACPAKPTYGKKPKVIASKSSSGGKKSNTGTGGK